MHVYFVKKLIVIVFGVFFLFSSLVNAEGDEYVCEAQQPSKDTILTLSPNCPIGSGLWGKEPNADHGIFWIQCGLLDVPLSMKKAQAIYEKILADVWIKPELKGYRCLIGPYEKYSIAKDDLIKVQKIAHYKEAFIRDASKLETVASQKKLDITPKPVEPQMTAIKAPVINKEALKKEELKVEQVEPTQTSEAQAEIIVVRKDVKIADKYYAIPFLMEGYSRFYMEYGIAWNRLSYKRAMEVCQSQDMRLVNADEWKLLIDSQVMSENQWPLNIPYWGEGKKGLFISGKIKPITGASLLNVLCVKS